MKKLLVLLLLLAVTVTPFNVTATETASVYPFEFASEDYWYKEAAAEYISDGDAKALLLMEYSTGKVLFSENETEHLPIASVTKVISTLLVVEAIDSGKIALGDMVTVSEYAASMGGSQVFLEAGEQMSVEDLLKSVIVVSANDATVALGEHICGSEAAFIAEMNSRAKELGCENSNFVNTNGLPADDHYSCALDIALITRELMKHELVFNYTKIWMDTIRNGAFGLANTNKLIRFYTGATGMKTGFTGEAKYCLSGTAERDGMQLIAVVLGASTSDKRFAAAKGLLDYGFANYSVVVPEPPQIQDITVTRGIASTLPLEIEPITILCEKGEKGEIEAKAVIEDSLSAPVKNGTDAGYISYCRNGNELARAKVTVNGETEEVSYISILKNLLDSIFSIF